MPADLTITADGSLVSDAEILVSVIPSEFLRLTLARLAPHMRAGQIIVSATKGVENQTLYRMSEVIAAVLEPTGLGLPIGAFSGPTFALEVAQGQPTAVTVAFSDPAVATRVQQDFSSETLRLYTSTDLIGVELGGALKNVIAIAAGVTAGIGLGYNSAAGLITRGIAEITFENANAEVLGKLGEGWSIASRMQAEPPYFAPRYSARSVTGTSLSGY